MPSYSDFNDLRDYLRQRCRQHSPPLTIAELSALLFGPNNRNYLYSVLEGSVKESSSELMSKVAAYFGDEPTLVQTLADLQPPPADYGDCDTRELIGLLDSLPTAKRQRALEYLRFLTE